MLGLLLMRYVCRGSELGRKMGDGSREAAYWAGARSGQGKIGDNSQWDSVSASAWERPRSAPKQKIDGNLGRCRVGSRERMVVACRSDEGKDVKMQCGCVGPCGSLRPKARQLGSTMMQILARGAAARMDVLTCC